MRCVPGSVVWCVAGASAVAAALACQPRVAVEAPKDPIVINMNIKIEHEIRVQVDRDLEALIASDQGGVF